MSKNCKAKRPTVTQIANARGVVVQAYLGAIEDAAQDFLAEHPEFRGPVMDDAARDRAFEAIQEFSKQHPLARDVAAMAGALLGSRDVDQALYTFAQQHLMPEFEDGSGLDRLAILGAEFLYDDIAAVVADLWIYPDKTKNGVAWAREKAERRESVAAV